MEISFCLLINDVKLHTSCCTLFLLGYLADSCDRSLKTGRSKLLGASHLNWDFISPFWTTVDFVAFLLRFHWDLVMLCRGGAEHMWCQHKMRQSALVGISWYISCWHRMTSSSAAVKHFQIAIKSPWNRYEIAVKNWRQYTKAIRNQTS